MLGAIDLEALEKRVSMGFDTLLEMEVSGKTGDRYPDWFVSWERLLCQYEAELARLGVTSALGVIG